MNKKGFSLIELIGSIVILGVIVLLATAGYGNISKKVKEKNLENKISYIEDAAAKYASETGYLTTNVQELMEKGYITADKNSGDVLNPVNDSKMNCHIVTIREENNNFYASYTETEECDLSNLDIVNINLRIDKYDESGKKLEVEEWTRSNVTLEVNFKDSNIDISKVSRITWISNGGREEVAVNNDFDSKKEKTVSASQIMNTGYSVEVLLNDGVIYQARTTVRIDKQRPVVYKDELEIEKENSYVNHDRKVKVTASDLNGSGVYGYYIGVSRDCKNVSYEKGTEAFEKTLDNGEYYVCVKDNVGNISEDESNVKIEINRIDKVGPKCEWSGESNVWTNNAEGRTITLKGVDNESGSDSVYTETYTSGTVKSKTLSYTIKDEAGNETKCEKEVNIYVDYEAPSCNWSGDSANWVNTSRTITLKGTDNGSGSTSSYTKTYKEANKTVKTDKLSYEVTDAVGNKRICEEEVNVYVDKEAPTCNWSGNYNETSWTKDTRSVSVSGTDNGSGINFNTNRTWTYSSGVTGTVTLSQNIQDNVGNQATCTKTANVYVDKEAPTCSISVSGTSGSSGWYTSDVTFSLNVNDGNGSGINNNRKSITSTKLASNVANHVVNGSVYDNAGNYGSCSVSVKRDSSSPSISKKNNNPVYLKVDRNTWKADSAMTNYYSVSWTTSGTGSVTCTSNGKVLTDTNQLPFGVNTIRCTATGNNGLSNYVDIEIRHKYDAKNNGHYCESGWSKVNDSQCKKTSTQNYNYSCPGGYTQSGTNCNNSVPDNHWCPAGYTDTGSGCSKSNTSTVNATASCSKGSLSNGKCTGSFSGVTTSATCWSFCTSNGGTYSSWTRGGGDKGTCSCNYSGNPSYSCPAGYTLSGTTCSTSSTENRDYDHYCPDGYTRNGVTCNITISATKSCPSGYSDRNNHCEKDEYKGTLTSYSCDNGGTLSGTECLR